MVRKQNLPYYEIEGRLYHRVTRVISVLKDPEYEDFGGRKDLNNAARFGTKVHQRIERFWEGRKQKAFEIPEEESCWQAFTDWQKSRQVVPEAFEHRIHLASPNVAGTIDLLEPGIVTDFKTSSRILWKHHLQCAAYCYMTGKARYRILRLDKNLGLFEEVVRDFRSELWDCFLGCFTNYLALYGRKIESDWMNQIAQHTTELVQ